jgi:O-antigen/teichoic acid export membrane protein
MSSQIELEPPTIEEPKAAPAPQLVEKAGLAVFWNAAFLPLKFAVQLCASVVLFRVLNFQEVALYIKVSSLATLLGALSDIGIERALPRFIPEIELQGGRNGVLTFLRNVGLIRSLVLLPFLLAMALFPAFFWDRLAISAQDLPAGFSDTAQLQPLLLGIVAALLLLGAISDISYQVLLTYFRQKHTNLIDIINLLIPALRIAGVLLLGVLGAIYALLVGTFVSTLVSLGLTNRALQQENTRVRKPPADKQPQQSLWRRFLSLSLLMHAVTLSAMLYDRPLIVTLITFLIIDRDRQGLMIGLLGLCFYVVRQILNTLATPMSGVQTPLFARLYTEGRLDGLRTAYASLTKFLILLLFPAGVGLIIMSRNLLMLLFGQARAGQVLTIQTLPEVVIATALLTFGLFGEAIISPAMNVLLVFEKHRVVLIARLISLLSLPLLLLLIPPFGVVGAAAAVAFTALASRVVALVYGLRVLELRFPMQFCGRVAGATLAFMLVIAPLAGSLPVQPTSIAPLEAIKLAGANGLLVLGAVAIFLFVFRRLGGIDNSDKLRFQGMRIPGIKLLLRYL